MPAAERQFLIRGPDGRMATILARTHVGALKRWKVQNPRKSGNVSVKARGDGDTWTHYRITR